MTAPSMRSEQSALFSSLNPASWTNLDAATSNSARPRQVKTRAWALTATPRFTTARRNAGLRSSFRRTRVLACTAKL